MSIFLLKCILFFILFVAIFAAYTIYTNTQLELKRNKKTLHSLRQSLKSKTSQKELLEEKVAFSDISNTNLQQHIITICKEILDLQEMVLKYRE